MPWPKLWPSSTKDEPNSGAPLTGKNAYETAHSEVADLSRSTGSTKLHVNDVNPAASYTSAFMRPETIVASIFLTTASLGLFRFYRSYLRRIPQATDIKTKYFRRRSLVGKVTSVGDGDNFRFYHTPGGRLAGWNWFPGRRIPSDRKELRDKTIHLRLAGIDAPELAHFGRPSQPYAQEALDWLTKYVLGRRVRAYVYKIDQYSRVVGTAYVWRGIFRRDVGLQMIRAGLATVYQAKSGAEFGEGLETKYRKAEWWAKAKRKGMWASSKADFESPREYKTRHRVGSPQDETKQ